MPVYNCSKFLDKSITSILKQTYQNIEILIADDGSKDDSKLIIEKYAAQDSRIKCVHNETNKGYLHTVNKLFPLCKGAYIGFQDADDFSAIERIETQVLEFQKDPTLQACMCSYNRVFYQGKKTLVEENVLDYTWEDINKNTRPFPYCAASIILKKEVLEKHGYYHEYFDRIGAEHLYWILKIAMEDKMISIKEVGYNYVYNNDSFTSTPSSIKQLHIKDFAFFLIDQRKQHKDDGLHNSDLKKDLIAYENSMLERYQSTPKILSYLKLYRALRYYPLKKSLPMLFNNIPLFFRFNELREVAKIFKERKS
jgi:glycosyltransferase involved in cell wall biosynthesis